jgi:xanthine dehydrogenase molybdopterin-binding subunit B
MLGISVWLAAKHAINQLNPDRLAKLSLPATCEANLICITETIESMAPA